MILYHGSNQPIAEIDLSQGKKFKDFDKDSIPPTSRNRPYIGHVELLNALAEHQLLQNLSLILMKL